MRVIIALLVLLFTTISGLAIAGNREKSDPSSGNPPFRVSPVPLAGVDEFLRVKWELAPYAFRFGWKVAERAQSVPCDYRGIYSGNLQSVPENKWHKIETSHFCRDYRGVDGHLWRISYSRDPYNKTGERVFRIVKNQLVLMVEFSQNYTIVADNTGGIVPSR